MKYFSQWVIPIHLYLLISSNRRMHCNFNDNPWHRYHGVSYLSSIIKWTQTGSATNQIRWTTQIPSVFQQWLVFHFVNQKKRRSRTNGLLLQIPELPKLHFQTTLHTPPMASSLTLFFWNIPMKFWTLINNVKTKLHSVQSLSVAIFGRKIKTFWVS